MIWIQRLGIVVLALVALLILALAGTYLAVGGQLRETTDVSVVPIPIPSGPAALERGRHLTEAIAACTGCHGEDLGGMVMVDSAVFGRFSSPNLTSGEGGRAAAYTDLDWVRAVRHGLDPAGRPLILMPSASYQHLSEDDLGAILAYVKSVPPVDRAVPRSSLGPVARAIQFASGEFLDARRIDHAFQAPSAPSPGPTPAYGNYLANICRTCHGKDLGGGMGPDLLVGGTLEAYNDERFMFALRTGKAADGRQIDTQDMPWQNFARMTDDEIAALWQFLSGAPDVR